MEQQEHKLYRNFDVFNCYGTGILSRMIKRVTGYHISHTAIYIELDGYPFIFDAQKNGANLKNFYEWKKEYNYNYEVRRCPYIFNAAKARMRVFEKCGLTAYDFVLLILRHPLNIFLSLITGKEFKPKRKKNEDNRMVCSELIAYVYGFSDPEDYTPKDFHKRCIKEYWQIIK